MLLASAKHSHGCPSTWDNLTGPEKEVEFVSNVRNWLKEDENAGMGHQMKKRQNCNERTKAGVVEGRERIQRMRK